MKNELNELKELGYSISLISKQTGISYTRLYNAYSGRPSKFHRVEKEAIIKMLDGAETNVNMGL